MKFKALLLVLLFAISSVYAQQTPVFVADSLDAHINRAMQQWHIPGLAIAIVKDGKVITKAYGMRDVEKKLPVTANTLFCIASNTKLFTGTLLAALQQEKKISLNDKVSKYLPQFKLESTEASDMVTVRDILCHRLGTETFQGDFIFWNSNLSRDSILAHFGRLKAPYAFRTKYGYCNTGFVAAGMVAEKVSGKTWEQEMTDRFIKPLDMKNTFTSWKTVTNLADVSVPYSWINNKMETVPYDKLENFNAAASMVSNVNDLSHWLQFQLDSGKYNGTRLMPYSVLRETRDANIVVNSRKHPTRPSHFSTYGLGVFNGDYNGRQVYNHTGGAFGFVTGVCFVPEERLGIAILTNQDNQAFFETLRYTILDAYLGVPYTDRSAASLKAQQKFEREQSDSLKAWRLQAKAFTKKAPAYAGLGGKYANSLYGTITVITKGKTAEVSFEHHPDVKATLQFVDDKHLLLVYNHPGYGEFKIPYTHANGKAVQLGLKVNDFLDGDAYPFERVQ